MPSPPLSTGFDVAADGSVLTVPSSGFQSIVGSLVRYSTVDPYHGVANMRVSQGASYVQSYAVWNGYGVGAFVDVWHRFYIKISANPSATTAVLRILDAAGARCAQLDVTFAGKLLLENAAGGTAASGAVSLTPGSWARVEVRVRASSTDGEVEARLYKTPDSSTPSETLLATGAVLGTSIDGIRIGAIATTGGVNVNFDFDELASSLAGWIGPIAGVPAASFTATPNSGGAPLAVNFTDTSTNTPNAWSWDFGDGSPSDSDSGSQNPSHTYLNPGTYTVRLTASNSEGSSTITQTVTVLPVLPFENTFDGGVDGDSITAANSGAFSGTAFQSVVGTLAKYNATAPHSGARNMRIVQGATFAQAYVVYSGLALPLDSTLFTRLYCKIDTYPSVTTEILRVLDNAGSRVASVSLASSGHLILANAAGSTLGVGSIGVSQGAWFRLELRVKANSTTGEAELRLYKNTNVEGNTTPDETLSATNAVLGTTIGGIRLGNVATTGEVSRTWDFDDVKLSTAGFIGPIDTTPVADFAVAPVSGIAPQAVTFTDLSSHTPTSWSWNFGDGGTSTVQNPTHTYTAEGTYTVTLTATNSRGFSTVSKVAVRVYAAVAMAVKKVGGTRTVKRAGGAAMTVKRKNFSVRDIYLPPAGKAWWGTTDSSRLPVSEMENVTLNGARQMDMVHVYKEFSDYTDTKPFPANTSAGQSIADYVADGKLVYIDWTSTLGGLAVPGGWASIAAGDYDVSYIDVLADKVLAFYNANGRRKIFLGFSHESDLHITHNEGFGTALEFRAAYRHIHDRFVARGADAAVIWVWTAEGHADDTYLWNDMYPGDDVVDWLGYDPYGKVSHTKPTSSRTWHKSNGQDEQDAGKDTVGAYRFYKWAIGDRSQASSAAGGLTWGKQDITAVLAGDLNKPIMLSEFGAAYDPTLDSANLAAWRTYWDGAVTEMAAGRYSHIRALMTFCSLSDQYDMSQDVGSGTVVAPESGSCLERFRALAALSRFNSTVKPY